MTASDVCHTAIYLGRTPHRGKLLNDDDHQHPEYLLDQAKRRLTPSFNNFPGMAASNRGC